ncbi:MAG: hypothetical protein R3D58_17930 [Saprospiraceae bacterium]
MKKKIAIALAVVLLAHGFAPLLQHVAMVPALFMHFLAHYQHQHGAHGDEFTVFDFFAQHYGNQPHHDDAGREHSNLPFHCSDVSNSGLLPALPAASLSPAVVVFTQFPQRLVFGSKTIYTSLFVRDVFKPPLG